MFGGKGGVGKSTLACALALRLSEKGSTLLASLDPAHSLSGILKTSVGGCITQVLPQLHAVELDAQSLAQEYVERVLESLEDVLSPSALEGAKRFASLISSSPTSLETAVFDRLCELLPQYEYVVLDFAPTGQVLRFFGSLNLAQEWLEFLVRLSQRQEQIDRFMNRKRNLPQLLKERLQKVKLLSEILKEKGLLFAVAREEPLSLQEADTLEKNTFIKAKRVINCAEGETKELGIPKVEEPYGLENLKKIPIEKLASL